MAHIKTTAEIEVMKQGGAMLSKIRDRLLDEVKVGVTPLEIDALAFELIKKTGGTASFLTVKDYKWATCISVNDVVVHGIPTSEPFKEGDRVGVDIGLLYEGYHTDTSWSKVIDDSQSGDYSKVENFLKIGEKALEKAIGQAKVGNRIGHISKAIQDTVEGAGYSVVKSLVGHGIGKKLHESPQVPGILTGKIEHTLSLQQGMVLAIEVIYNQGKPEIVYKNDDGWTLASEDGSLSGLFEDTVLITEKEPIILT